MDAPGRLQIRHPSRQSKAPARDNPVYHVLNDWSRRAWELHSDTSDSIIELLVINALGPFAGLPIPATLLVLANPQGRSVPEFLKYPINEGILLIPASWQNGVQTAFLRKDGATLVTYARDDAERVDEALALAQQKLSPLQNPRPAANCLPSRPGRDGQDNIRAENRPLAAVLRLALSAFTLPMALLAAWAARRAPLLLNRDAAVLSARRS